MTKQKKSLIIWSAVTLAAALALAFTLDWPGVLSAISHVSVWDLLLSALFIHVSKVAYAAKWKVFLPDFRFGLVYHTVLGSMPLFLLPAGGFVSDAYRIAAMTGRGNDYQAVSAILLDRLTMPLSILCICLPLSVMSGDGILPGYAYWLLALTALLAIAAIALLLNGRTRRWLVRLTEKLPKLHGLLQKASEAIDSMHIGLPAVLLSILLGFCGDVLTSGAYFAFGASLGISLPLGKWLFVYSLPLIANTAIPTAAGIGVRDAALVAFLSLYGVSSSTAVSLSTLYLGALIVAALVGLGLHWLTRRRFSKARHLS